MNLSKKDLAVWILYAGHTGPLHAVRAGVVTGGDAKVTMAQRLGNHRRGGAGLQGQRGVQTSQGVGTHGRHPGASADLVDLAPEVLMARGRVTVCKQELCRLLAAGQSQ